MNFRTTLIIIVLLVGIAGAYFLFFQQSPEDASTNEKPPIHQVYGITSEKVQQMEVLFADTETYQNLQLVKDAMGNWHLERPFQADADSEKVNQMLDDMLNKRVKQTLEVTDLAQYGLDTPSITLSLWTEQGSPAVTTFLIGKKAISFSVYVKEKSEAHIFLIESSALDDLTKSPADLRSRSVITFNTETVSNIQFVYGDIDARPLTCEKRDGTWFVTHPIEAKADTQEIEDILSELRALQVLTFEADGADANVPAQLEKSGLESPRIQMKLTDGNNTYALDIGSEVASENGSQRNVYVKSVHQEAIYTVSDDIYRLLNKSVFDLRDKRVIDFQRTDTIRIAIKQNQEMTVCTKNDDNIWELQTPTGRGWVTQPVRADAKAVDDLLFGIDSLEAAAFVDSPVKNLASYGLASPLIEVAFTQRGEEKPAVLHIGDYTTDGTVYVKGEPSDQVARVERALIDKIAMGAAWLRDKQVLNFHIDDAVRLTLLHGEESLTCQRLGTNWRLTAPVKEEANNTKVNAIIYELDNLMVDGFVRNDSALTEAITGLRTPQLQLTVELRNQKVYTLQVGNQAAAPGRFYARLQHEPNLIFLLNAELVPKLKTTLALLRMP